MNAKLFTNDRRQERAAMSSGDLVLAQRKIRYGRRGRRPSKWRGGIEYPWSSSKRTFGRWARGRGGGLFFEPFDDGEALAAEIGGAIDERSRRASGKEGREGGNYRKLLQEMEAEEKRILPMLERLGRKILSDAGRKADISVKAKRLDAIAPQYANKTVDLLKTDPTSDRERPVQRPF